MDAHGFVKASYPHVRTSINTSSSDGSPPPTEQVCDMEHDPSEQSISMASTCLGRLFLSTNAFGGERLRSSSLLPESCTHSEDCVGDFASLLLGHKKLCHGRSIMMRQTAFAKVEMNCSARSSKSPCKVLSHTAAHPFAVFCNSFQKTSRNEI